MRAERAAQQTAGVDAAVGDQPILGLGIFLVEKMIAEREKDGPALDACGSLHNMGMMPDDKVRPVLDQPARLLLLRIGWPILQFVAPMDRYHDEIRQLASQPQLLRQLDRGNLLHSPIGGLDGRHRNQIRPSARRSERTAGSCRSPAPAARSAEMPRVFHFGPPGPDRRSDYSPRSRG